MFLVICSDSGASSVSRLGSPRAFVAHVAAETSCPTVTGGQSSPRGSGEPIRELHLVLELLKESVRRRLAF